jgi:hypothetical protein
MNQIPRAAAGAAVTAAVGSRPVGPRACDLGRSNLPVEVRGL